MKLMINKLKNGFVMLLILLFLFPLLSFKDEKSCKPAGKKNIFSLDNLVAWCIVPFDAAERSPEERGKMLEELGFRKMAWDWRPNHLKQLPDEIKALKRHNIQLSGIWFPMGSDSKDGLTSAHYQIFDAIADAGIKTTYWVSLSDDFFSGTDDEEKVNEGVRAISSVYQRAKETGSRVALYNHGGWAGDPENQVKIIEKYGKDGAGIIFNFHHAHHRSGEFKQLLDLMMPYLYTVNLNGMNKEGPKILDIGSGKEEARMIKILLESDFCGTVGILGHVAEEDVQRVLKRNLQGLRTILDDLD